MAAKCKRLLIIAIPNEIFELLDACETSKDLWAKLERPFEGGAKLLRKNRALCINEYFSFKAMEGEALKDVYNRFNLLVNKCRRFGVERSSEDSNLKFIQSLNPEWMPLSMSVGFSSGPFSVILSMRRTLISLDLMLRIV